jgi:hypothetical protein
MIKVPLLCLKHVHTTSGCSSRWFSCFSFSTRARLQIPLLSSRVKISSWGPFLCMKEQREPSLGMDANAWLILGMHPIMDPCKGEVIGLNAYTKSVQSPQAPKSQRAMPPHTAALCCQSRAPYIVGCERGREHDALRPAHLLLLR